MTTNKLPFYKDAKLSDTDIDIQKTDTRLTQALLLKTANLKIDSSFSTIDYKYIHENIDTVKCILHTKVMFNPKMLISRLLKKH